MNGLRVLVILAALGASGCRIAPVMTESSGNGAGYRYGDCRRAARDACKYRESGDDARKQCVAEATYECVKGSGE